MYRVLKPNFLLKNSTLFMKHMQMGVKQIDNIF